MGRGPSSGGKAPILVQVVEDARVVIGLDLGEQHFAGALVDLRGGILRRIEVPVEGRDGGAALRAVERLVDELVAQAPAGRLLGIGVGTPGLVDTANGEIRWAVNLDWQDLHLGRILTDRTGLPAFVANDSRAAAMGEYLFDVGRRAPNLVAIKLGHGIGAGIVLGGELFEGDGFGAGEIGHTSVVDDGIECRCGRFGCLETVASSRASSPRRWRPPRSTRTASSRVAWPPRPNPRSTTSPPPSPRAMRMPAGSPPPPAAGSAGPSPRSSARWTSATSCCWAASPTSASRGWTRSATRPLVGRSACSPARRGSRSGGAAEDTVLLGASALLITRELGLVPAR